MTEVVAAEARLAYRGSQSVITCAPGGVVTLSEDTAAWVLTATPKPFTASSAVRLTSACGLKTASAARRISAGSCRSFTAWPRASVLDSNILVGGVEKM